MATTQGDGKPALAASKLPDGNSAAPSPSSVPSMRCAQPRRHSPSRMPQAARSGRRAASV